MAPLSPNKVLERSSEAGGGNGTPYATVSHEAGASEPMKVGSYSNASEEETNPLMISLEEWVTNHPEDKLKQEDDDLRIPEEKLKLEEHVPEIFSSTALPVTDKALPEGSSSETVEYVAVVGTQKEGFTAILLVAQEDGMPNVVQDLVKQNEIPASGDEDKKHKDHVPILQGVEPLQSKQGVAYPSDVSKLDDESARQLLNDSGWYISQSVRQNGKSQWYYRSPGPKPVLLSSLASAVAVWKKLVDEDKKRWGGDEDLYPMVTDSLITKKNPSARKRKRGPNVLNPVRTTRACSP